jgi:hypothetical protein
LAIACGKTCRTPAEGADTPIWLVCDELPPGTTAKFFGNGRQERGWVTYG